MTGLQEECECGTGFHFIIAFTEVSDIVVKSSQVYSTSKAVKLILGHF